MRFFSYLEVALRSARAASAVADLFRLGPALYNRLGEEPHGADSPNHHLVSTELGFKSGSSYLALSSLRCQRTVYEAGCRPVAQKTIQ
jgi:hypothetical protein